MGAHTQNNIHSIPFYWFLPSLSHSPFIFAFTPTLLELQQNTKKGKNEKLGFSESPLAISPHREGPQREKKLEKFAQAERQRNKKSLKFNTSDFRRLKMS